MFNHLHLIVILSNSMQYVPFHSNPFHPNHFPRGSKQVKAILSEKQREAYSARLSAEEEWLYDCLPQEMTLDALNSRLKSFTEAWSAIAEMKKLEDKCTGDGTDSVGSAGKKKKKKDKKSNSKDKEEGGESTGEGKEFKEFKEEGADGADEEGKEGEKKEGGETGEEGEGDSSKKEDGEGKNAGKTDGDDAAKKEDASGGDGKKDAESFSLDETCKWVETRKGAAPANDAATAGEQSLTEGLFGCTLEDIRKRINGLS
jgi:hypothetical protein